MKIPSGAALVAALLLAACGAVGPGGGGSGPLPSDVGGMGQDCGQGGHLAERISTDARSYPSGARILVTLSATNTSSAACGAPFGCSPAVAVDNSGGAEVWHTPPVARPCTLLLRLLSPGESVSTQVAIDAQLPAGVYSVTGPARALQDALGRAYFRVV